MSPFERVDELLPDFLLGLVHRATPIPTLAARAAAVARETPSLVRADIGQISSFDANQEVLYGSPAGLDELRTLVAELWNLTFDLASTPDFGEQGLSARNVAITTGAAEGLAILFRCFAHRKVVGLPTAHWENYSNSVDVANGRYVCFDFFDRDGNLDIAGIRQQVKAHDIAVLVCNFPANPIAAVLDETEAQQLADLARECDVILIADEVYNRLRFDGNPAQTIIKYAPERAICVSSASKEYLIPGARVGYVLCAHADITDRVVRKMVRANTGSPNVLGQHRLLALLRDDVADLREGKVPRHFDAVLREMRARQERLVAVLSKHGFPLVGRAKHDPISTIFLMAGLPEWWRGDDEAFSHEALEAGCVSTIPGAAFGMPGSVRFSFGGMTTDAITRLDANLARFRANCETTTRS